jgi:hypothetical protein
VVVLNLAGALSSMRFLAAEQRAMPIFTELLVHLKTDIIEVDRAVSCKLNTSR